MNFDLFVRFCAAVFEHCSWYDSRSPFKQLQWSHDLLFIRSLKTCSCSKAFHGATNSVTSTFAMGGHRKMLLGLDSKISLVIAQIDKLFCSFCTVKLRHLKNIWSSLHDMVVYFSKVNQVLLKEVNSNSVVMQAVGNNNVTEVTIFSRVHIVDYKWMDCCLGIIPMKSLCCILENKWISSYQ